MQNRLLTNKIVIHHSASPVSTTMEQVDGWHRNQGFSMIGYHYFIEADGEVRIGRPDWAIGAHALSANKDGLGICLAGNFEEAPPLPIQIISLVSLIKEIRMAYGDIPVVRHSDVDPTACPGALFPYELVLERLGEGVDDVLVDIKVIVKGQELTGKVIDNVTYVPARALVDALNYQVSYDATDRVVTIK